LAPLSLVLVLVLLCSRCPGSCSGPDFPYKYRVCVCVCVCVCTTHLDPFFGVVIFVVLVLVAYVQQKVKGF